MYMNYKEIEVYKAKEGKKIKWVLIFGLCMLTLIVFTKSLIFGFLLGVVIMIPTLSITFEFMGRNKSHKQLANKYNWDEESIVLSTNGMNLKPSYIILMTVVYSIMYFCVISVVKDFLSWGVLLSVVIISLVGVGVILKSALSISKYSILVTPCGVAVNKVKYAFAEMKRHQFIKVKKGGYIFEVNTGKTYFKLFVKDDEKQLIENMLNK